MFVWKGMGLIIPIFLGLFVYLTGFAMGEELKSSQLHYGCACILTGFFVWLTIWKKADNDEKYLNHEDPVKQANYRKSIESNPMMDIKNSSLFFIPFAYWQYILWVGGAVLLVMFYVK